jgi:hypothetical protein
MNDTGIGYAGLDGVWWLPACEPFHLPQAVADELAEIGQAVFSLLDVVAGLYGSDDHEAVNRLLEYKVPAQIIKRMAVGPVYAMRPDFQLYPLPDGRCRPVVTEVEICPSAFGFAHAMQVGYGVDTDLRDAFGSFLDGRELLVVGTTEWSEFLFDQLAFCKALDGAGGTGRILYDRPFADIAESVRLGKRWTPPMFGVRERPDEWDVDVLGRINRHQLDRYLWPDATGWPEHVGDDVVFRFGYTDLFSPAHLDLFERWQTRGATFLNPAAFILDSKAMMAALSLSDVREQIEATRPGGLTILDQCVPETVLMRSNEGERLTANKDDWVLKFAGFDGLNRAWGGRSLQVGTENSQTSWEQALQLATSLPWPVVAQRAVPSLRTDIAYFDEFDEVCWLGDGNTRLRAFFLRGDVTVTCGAHITVTADEARVAEGTETVQAPVVFS